MKYLVSMTHGPETCAFTDEQRRERARQAGERVAEIAQGHDVTILAGFTNPVAHRAWLYVEADAASRVEQVLMDTGMFLQNTCDIQPVHTLEETAAMLEQR